MKINGSTKLLGIIGDPIAQARTPEIANQMLAQKSLLGSYVLVPMHTSREGLAHCIIGLQSMQNFSGAVVTMPHKSQTALLVDELTDEAKLVGAVNVIRRNANGITVGTILDGEGFAEGLNLAGYNIAGQNCILYGAGGAAAAIAFALANRKCRSLCIVNRTHEKADSLAKRLQSSHPALKIYTDVPKNIAIDIAIAECVIAPEITPLIAIARSRGCQTHTGNAMLTAQMHLMLKFMGVKQ